MSAFKERLENDPDFLKKKQEDARTLYQERTHLLEQLKNARMGKPHLSYTLDRKIQNTKALEEQLIKASTERQEIIKREYAKFKYEKAKELGEQDKEGYQKWLKTEQDKAKFLKKRDEMKSQTKEITKDRDRDNERER